MESNPLRDLFGVSSPLNSRAKSCSSIFFEIPSGMIEKLLANPFTGDGTLHPDMHLIKKKVFPLSLKGKALT